MKQIVITLDSADIADMEKQGDKDAVAKVEDLDSIFEQMIFVICSNKIKFLRSQQRV